MTKISNLKPSKAEKFLIKHGWEPINRKGTHCTFWKQENGKDKFCQIIDNNKTIYPKNAKIMIEKSGIPEEEWIKDCK